MGWGTDDSRDDALTAREAENGIRQARRVADFVREAVARGKFRLTTDILCDLNRLAVEGIVETAGQLRVRSDIEIFGSQHVLPEHSAVPSLLEDACRETNFTVAAPTWVAAYVLWRICWIHPFEEGNGRTARAASYIVLCSRLGAELPGVHPIPERMRLAPIVYNRALEAADAAYKHGSVDVSDMQRLLEFYLEAQLADAPLGLPPWT